MKVEKLPVISSRIRRIPEGFGWLDHRLIRDGHLRSCSTDALGLYLVLAQAYVNDKFLSCPKCIECQR